ncbi:MAG: hypothetical protein Q6L68_08625 [Thermostichus sp. DG02_5_bins_236]
MVYGTQREAQNLEGHPLPGIPYSSLPSAGGFDPKLKEVHFPHLYPLP